MATRIPEVVQVVSGGNATLILGDLGDTPSGSPSLRELHSVCANRLQVDDPNAFPLHQLLAFLEVEDAEFCREEIKKHLSNCSARPSSLVRVIQAPWNRIYSTSGLGFSNIRFNELSNRVIHQWSSLPQPAESGETLLVDFSNGPDESIHSFAAPPPVSSERHGWFRDLEAKVLITPMVAISQESDPLLWRVLESRSAPIGDDSESELPLALLLLERPTISDALRARQAGVQLIPGNLDNLALSLAPGDQRIVNARKILSRRRNELDSTSGVRLVSSLTRGTVAGADWNFLRGFDPTWDDVVEQRPIRTGMLKELERSISLVKEHRNTVIVKARAGSGKTTALMACAAKLSARGTTAVWLDRSATKSGKDLLAEIEAVDPDCVFIDDADFFGDSTPDFLRIINNKGSRSVIAAVRTTRERSLGSLANVRYVTESQLSDPELKRLDALLNKAGLSGQLQGIVHDAARLDRLREICQRDLLAALIEIVTGQKFEERIRSEFEQLSETERELYVTLNFFVSMVNEARTMPRDELLQCAGSASARKYLTAMNSLVDNQMVVVHQDGLGVKHRAIGDALIRGMSVDILGGCVSRLLYFYASRAHAISDPTDPYRRNMIAMLSHKLMVRLNLPLEAVRKIYSGVQSHLQYDFHFWLQRGAYETEKGDPDLAESYLKSARSCTGGGTDYKVITEAGILALIQANRHPEDSQRTRDAVAAIREMIAVAKIKGSNSPHTFKVLAESGATFLRRNSLSLSSSEKAELARELDSIVSIGLQVCSDSLVAMEALEAYRKRRSGTVKENIVMPMPRTNNIPKPGPPKLRRG